MSYQQRLSLPPWAPDLSDNEAEVSLNVQNLLPRTDGWFPFKSFKEFTSPLPSTCFGFFYARNPDSSVQIFAGTANDLWTLNNTTFDWINVTLGGAGAYPTIPPLGMWQFMQFDNFVFAVQANVPPQTYTLQSSTKFANLGGSPPNATYIAIVNRFVVLSGIPGNLYRVQWSDLDNPTQWTAGVGLSDFQDLPDGGVTQGIAGFDLFAVIFQTSMARLMVFAPGSPVIFTISKITGGDGNGCFGPYTWTIDQDNVFWLSQEGMKMMAPGGAPTAVGKDLVDQFIFDNIDTGNLQLALMTTDPAAPRMFFAFKSNTGQAGLFDTLMVFDWRLGRWSRCFFSGEYIDVMSKPGLTIEAMDPVTPNAVQITNIAASPLTPKIRLTVTSTAAMATAAQQTTYGVWNITQVNCNSTMKASIYNIINNANEQWGQWTISIIDGTHVDLIGSTFAGTYTSGGYLGPNVELLPFSLDAVSTADLPALAACNPSNAMGFFNGPTPQAQIESGEQGTNEKRLFVRAFRVITDAAGVSGAVSYRDSAQDPYTYTTPVLIDGNGTCVVSGGGVDTRYCRAQITIPAGTVYTYIKAVEFDWDETGSY